MWLQSWTCKCFFFVVTLFLCLSLFQESGNLKFSVLSSLLSSGSRLYWQCHWTKRNWLVLLMKMVNYCCVLCVTSQSDLDKHLEYYRLRRVQKERRRLWLAKLNQDFQGMNLDHIYVCSSHFFSGRGNINLISHFIIYHDIYLWLVKIS